MSEATQGSEKSSTEIQLTVYDEAVQVVASLDLASGVPRSCQWPGDSRHLELLSGDFTYRRSSGFLFTVTGGCSAFLLACGGTVTVMAGVLSG